MTRNQTAMHGEEVSVGAPSASMRRVLALRDFRLLLAGASTSLLGDQFALIATPWLVLQLSNDPLALGIVLALEGLPRAGFMLVGGAMTDRFAPRRVMIAADVARGALTAAMALVVLTDVVQMWMLYGYAGFFGLVSGFAIPQKTASPPASCSAMISRREDLADHGRNAGQRISRSDSGGRGDSRLLVVVARRWAGVHDRHRHVRPLCRRLLAHNGDWASA